MGWIAGQYYVADAYKQPSFFFIGYTWEDSSLADCSYMLPFDHAKHYSHKHKVSFQVFQSNYNSKLGARHSLQASFTSLMLAIMIA